MLSCYNHTYIGYLTAPVFQTRVNSYKYFVPSGTAPSHGTGPRTLKPIVLLLSFENDVIMEEQPFKRN